MQNTNPLISVITVVLNAKDHIENTILSVIEQSYPNIEYIVIDGGSTDETLDIIEKYRNKISKIISEPDNGIFDAMNKGIELATGDYINFMNAGDSFYSNNVIETVFSQANLSSDIIYGDTLVNFQIGTYSCQKIISAPPVNADFWKWFPCHQSCFTKIHYLKNNKFDPKHKQFADYALLLDFKYNQNLKFQKQNLVIARYLGGGISSMNVFENPRFSTLKKRIDKWRLVSKYVNSPKMYLYNFLLCLRTFILIIMLKFIPNKWKIVVLNKYFK